MAIEVEVAQTGRRGTYAKTPGRQLEIVEVAAAVFAARGYAGGSLRQIARDIGLSVTSVMHHFPSKEILLEAVLDHADTEAVRAADVNASRDGLLGTIARLVRDGEGHPNLLRLLAMLSAEATDPEHPAHSWFIRRYERVEGAVRDWIAADPDLDVPPADQRSLARQIVGLWDGLQLQWLLRGGFDLAEELDAGVAALLGQSTAGRDAVQR